MYDIWYNIILIYTITFNKNIKSWYDISFRVLTVFLIISASEPTEHWGREISAVSLSGGPELKWRQNRAILTEVFLMCGQFLQAHGKTVRLRVKYRPDSEIKRAQTKSGFLPVTLE